MYLIRDKKPTFNKRYLTKRMLVAMLYPLIIGIGSTITTISDETITSLLLILCIMIFFFPFISYFVISRNWYSIISIYFDEANSTFEIVYIRRGQKIVITAHVSDLRARFGNDPLCLHPFYLLEIFCQDKVIKQYEEGEWEKEDFFRVIKRLSDCGVKCEYSFEFKKQIDQSDPLVQ